MKVEVDADELCELRMNASATVAFGAMRAGIDLARVDTLTKERDFWKEKCGDACRWYDSLLAEVRAAHKERVVSGKTRFNAWQSEADFYGLNK